MMEDGVLFAIVASGSQSRLQTLNLLRARETCGFAKNESPNEGLTRALTGEDGIGEVSRLDILA